MIRSRCGALASLFAIIVALGLALPARAQQQCQSVTTGDVTGSISITGNITTTDASGNTTVTPHSSSQNFTTAPVFWVQFFSLDPATVFKTCDGTTFTAVSQSLDQTGGNGLGNTFDTASSLDFSTSGVLTVTQTVALTSGCTSISSFFPGLTDADCSSYTNVSTVQYTYDILGGTVGISGSQDQNLQEVSGASIVASYTVSGSGSFSTSGGNGSCGDQRDAIIQEYIDNYVTRNGDTPQDSAPGCSDFTQTNSDYNTEAHRFDWWMVAVNSALHLGKWRGNLGAVGLGPRRVNSGYRSPVANIAAGGAPASPHMWGEAVDLQAKHSKPDWLLVKVAGDLAAKQLGISIWDKEDTNGHCGLGCVHIDVRDDTGGLINP